MSIRLIIITNFRIQIYAAYNPEVLDRGGGNDRGELMEKGEFFFLIKNQMKKIKITSMVGASGFKYKGSFS